MVEPYKNHGINNQKKALIKKQLIGGLLDFPHDFDNYGYKLAQYQTLKGDLDQPHTLDEIKKKIDYKGNDKEFREFLNYIGTHSEPQRIKKAHYPKKDNTAGRKKHLYQISPNKFQTFERCIWDLYEINTSIKKDKFIRIMKEMFEGSFRAYAQLIKYLKKLPEHQRLIEIEQFIEAREKEAPSYFMDKKFKNFFSKLLYNWTLK